MANVSWADFIGAVAVQLTTRVTYTYATNFKILINYDLQPYGVTDWDGVTGRRTGTFETNVGELGVLYRRYPSNGNYNEWMIWQDHADHTSFDNFGLTQTDLELFSIAPNTITNGTNRISASNWYYFSANGTLQPVTRQIVLQKIVEQKLGVKLSGSKNDGRTHDAISISASSVADYGHIQEYLATQELNLGFGGATDLGTGHGTHAPYISSGDGISMMDYARTKKRDRLW